MRILIPLIFSVVFFNISSAQLKPGYWQGRIVYDTHEIPFIFIIGHNKDDYTFTLVNASERKELGEVIVKHDSLKVTMAPFDVTLVAKFTNERMEGRWIKHYRGYQARFEGQYGIPRYPRPKHKPLEIQSPWRMKFKPDNGSDYEGVGLIEQTGNNVSGTILTETGDLRYFEGLIDGGNIRMSSFDGIHAFALEGDFSKKGWSGRFYSSDYHEEWTASWDPQASLANPFEIVVLKPFEHKPYFDILGKDANLNADDYFDKVVVIQLLGTWCPNSLDQTEYLTKWYKTQLPEQVEILGVTYEPNLGNEYAANRINSYCQALDIPYRIVSGGVWSKGDAALAFPFMDKILAYPTLIIIDKNGYARYVHSYFNGPATGKYYKEFDVRFNEIVNELLKE